MNVNFHSFHFHFLLMMIPLTWSCFCCGTTNAATSANTLDTHTLQSSSSLISIKEENTTTTDVPSSSTCLPLPCLLQNGCECNHSQTTFHDAQYFGTCTACAAGFTGFDCSSKIISCFNGGQRIEGHNATLSTYFHRHSKKSDGGVSVVAHGSEIIGVAAPASIGESQQTCFCPEGWGGNQCEHRQCVNSEDGTGPRSVRPPTPQDDNFCTHCKDGFGGLSCTMCNKDSACKGKNQRCVSNFDSSAKTILMECDVLQKGFLMPLGGGRDVHGIVYVNCTSEEGFLNPTTKTLSNPNPGSCHVSFFRVEPERSWVDPFFFCNLHNCSVRIKQSIAQEDTAESKKYSAIRYIRNFEEIFLLLCCLCFVSLVFVSNPSLKVRFFWWVALATVIALTIFIILIGVFMTRSTKTTTEYVCGTTECECGPDPPNSAYQPFCSTCMFGEKVLPSLYKGAQFTCDQNGLCDFLQLNLNSPIKLQCQASSCVDEGGSSSSGNDNNVPNSIVNKHVKGSSSEASSYLEKISGQKGAVVGVILLTIALFAALVAHYVHSYRRSKKSKEDFAVFYLSPQVLRWMESADEGDDFFTSVVDDDNTRNNTTATAVPVPSRGEGGGDNFEEENVSLVERAAHDDVAPTEEERRNERDTENSNSEEPPANRSQEERGRNTPNTTTTTTTTTTAADQLSSLNRERIARAKALLAPPTSGTTTSSDTSVMMPMSAPIAAASTSAAQPVPARTSSLRVFTFRAKDIHYYLTKSVKEGASMREVEILRGVDLTVRSGEIVALMGASGAGKTTLLDILCARAKSGNVTGELSLENCPVTSKNSHFFKSMVGYVPQEDTLLASLTVRQTITYAAKLKLPAAFSSKVKRRIVEDILVSLRLASCADTIIGDETHRGISGGEKRRVSIATELVSFPRLLFLDEPTSGLDSCSAMHVVETLSELARSTPLFQRYAPGYFNYRPIVVLSIHQPSAGIFSVFDRVVLLSAGDMIYSGPPGDAVRFTDRVLQTVPTAEETAELQDSARLRTFDESGHELSVPSSTPPENPKRKNSNNNNTRNTASNTLRADPSNPAEHLLLLEDSLTTLQRKELVRAARRNHIAESNDGSIADGRGSSHHRITMRSNLLNLNSEAIPLRPNEENDDPHAEEAPRITDERRQQQQRPSTSEHHSSAPVPLLSPDDVFDDDEPNPHELEDLALVTRKYLPNLWQQLAILSQRSRSTLLGSYYLIACHAAVTGIVASLLCSLYKAEGLNLPGSLNRAGSLTFLLLVLAQSSISCLELFISEKKLFMTERDNGYYSPTPYYVAKIVHDFVPLRIVPVLILGSLIYYPMGFRTDDGSYFLWFLVILVLFALNIVTKALCVGMLLPSFGTAALMASVLILYDFVYCGLMVQASTIPTFFLPFRLLSPFYLAFEALMINELNGQICTFAPTDETGKPSIDEIPLYCVQYLYNLGLEPSHFARDVTLLLLWFLLFVVLGWLLLRYYVNIKR